MTFSGILSLQLRRNNFKESFGNLSWLNVKYGPRRFKQTEQFLPKFVCVVFISFLWNINNIILLLLFWGNFNGLARSCISRCFCILSFPLPYLTCHSWRWLWFFSFLVHKISLEWPSPTVLMNFTLRQRHDKSKINEQTTRTTIMETEQQKQSHHNEQDRKYL